MRRSPEKDVERAGDALMAAFGFTAIRFSQARATMQTRGIPDRRYYREPTTCKSRHAFICQCRDRVRPFAVWWEAKAGTKQSEHQRAFQVIATRCGERYVLGGIEALEEYLISIGLARRVPGGIEGVRRGA